MENVKYCSIISSQKAQCNKYQCVCVQDNLCPGTISEVYRSDYVLQKSTFCKAQAIAKKQRQSCTVLAQLFVSFPDNFMVLIVFSSEMQIVQFFVALSSTVVYLQLNWNLTQLPSSPFLFHVYTKNAKKEFLPLRERENCSTFFQWFC